RLFGFFVAILSHHLPEYIYYAEFVFRPTQSPDLGDDT
ncbi:uncharacterized protein METZ01_LOCUS373815, partial [marine metagenome]